MQICPNCGYANRPGVVFCENCGTTLIGNAASNLATRALTPNERVLDVDDNASANEITTETSQDGASDALPKDVHLRLELGEAAKPIIVPMKELLVFGRRDAATGTVPDVDLTPYAGYRMGVSRKHAEIRRDEDESYIVLWDLGSSNGTFLNGDRLISHRPYRLEDGAQIRFGQLVMTLRFQKNNPAFHDESQDASDVD